MEMIIYVYHCTFLTLFWLDSKNFQILTQMQTRTAALRFTKTALNIHHNQPANQSPISIKFPAQTIDFLAITPLVFQTIEGTFSRRIVPAIALAALSWSSFPVQ